MPELPEVETVRRTLAPVVGTCFRGVWTSGKTLHQNRPIDEKRLRTGCVGVRLSRVRRMAKYLLLDFDVSGIAVVIHLGMTGRLRWVRAKSAAFPHTHVVWSAGAWELRFSDPRRFGLVSIAELGCERDHASLARLGVDPLNDALSAEDLLVHTRKSTRAIKLAILDQHVVSGVGNIYASEALWYAKIRPTTPCNRISTARMERLAVAIPSVLAHALDRGGTTLRDFVAVDGKTGEFADYLRVYGREGEPCPRRDCGGTIRRIVQQGRGTFYCPRCQC